MNVYSALKYLNIAYVLAKTCPLYHSEVWNKDINTSIHYGSIKSITGLF